MLLQLHLYSNLNEVRYITSWAEDNIAIHVQQARVPKTYKQNSMASASNREGPMPGLADYIVSWSPTYQERNDGQRVYFRVRTASDVLTAAEGFLRSQGFRERGMSMKDLAMRECIKLMRNNILELANRGRYSTLRRSSNCFVRVRVSSSRGSSSRRRR